MYSSAYKDNEMHVYQFMRKNLYQSCISFYFMISKPHALSYKTEKKIYI